MITLNVWLYQLFFKTLSKFSHIIIQITVCQNKRFRTDHKTCNLLTNNKRTTVAETFYRFQNLFSHMDECLFNVSFIY